jgi:hypothetical protein
MVMQVYFSEGKAVVIFYLKRGNEYECIFVLNSL